MSTKNALAVARAEYATSLRQLAKEALAVIERGLFDDDLPRVYSAVVGARGKFHRAHNADRVADLAQLPEAE
jgi:hypothetical protein